jgi:glycosyltransferase involved in cell wall biosynthesis
VNSVLSQVGSFLLEVIVVDDGSTDNTIEILSSFKDSLILIEKPKDIIEQGAAAARNRGLSVATGDFICFLDSDDYYLESYLSRMSDELLGNSSIDYVFCRQFCIQNNGTIKPWTRKNINVWDEKYHVLHRARVISTNIIMVRKIIIDRVGWFNTSLRNGEDSDLWIRISEQGKGKFIDFYGAVYRINHSQNQLTVSINEKEKTKLSKKVLINAFLRTIDFDLRDKIRLVIIFKNIIYAFMTKRGGLGFSILRFFYSSLLLTLTFPVSYIRYLAGFVKNIR